MDYEADRIEKYVFEHTGRVLYTMIPLLCFALFVFSSISGVIELLNNEYGQGISAIATSIIMAVCTVFSIKYSFLHRYWSSKLVLDKAGVNYKSKVKGYCLSWNEIKSIEVKGSGKIPFIFFYTYPRDKNNNISKNEKKLIASKEFIYMVLDFQALEFIEKYWDGTIGLNSSVKKHYVKYKERKNKRLLKKAGNKL